MFFLMLASEPFTHLFSVLWLSAECSFFDGVLLPCQPLLPFGSGALSSPLAQVFFSSWLSADCLMTFYYLRMWILSADRLTVFYYLVAYESWLLPLGSGALSSPLAVFFLSLGALTECCRWVSADRSMAFYHLWILVMCVCVLRAICCQCSGLIAPHALFLFDVFFFTYLIHSPF